MGGRETQATGAERHARACSGISWKGHGACGETCVERCHSLPAVFIHEAAARETALGEWNAPHGSLMREVRPIHQVDQETLS